MCDRVRARPNESFSWSQSQQRRQLCSRAPLTLDLPVLTYSRALNQQLTHERSVKRGVDSYTSGKRTSAHGQPPREEGSYLTPPLLFSLPPPTPHPLPPLQPHPLSANQGSLVEMLTPPTLAAGWFFRCILSLVQSLSSIFSSSLFVSPDIPLFRLPSCCARMHLCSRNHLTHRSQGYLLVVMFPWQ